MPRTCAVSGAKYQKINRRSHSMQATIVHREPNFILKRVGNKKVKVTARAMRTLRKQGKTLEQVLS